MVDSVVASSKTVILSNLLPDSNGAAKNVSGTYNPDIASLAVGKGFLLPIIIRRCCPTGPR